jgi:hypothetical protein
MMLYSEDSFIHEYVCKLLQQSNRMSIGENVNLEALIHNTSDLRPKDHHFSLVYACLVVVVVVVVVLKQACCKALLFVVVGVI